jgi:enoyl-CoA hydratase
MASNETIDVPERGRVAIITLNRPTVRNAMDSIMVRELAESVRSLEKQDEIQSILLTGSAPAFCSGIDTRQPFPGDLRDLYQHGFADREAVGLCRKPVVAAVSGAAFGAGFELALMADIIFADASVRFSLPEVTRQTMPGFGGTQRLARLVGRIRAMEICMSGRVVAAEEALRIGLVNQLLEPSELLEHAFKFAEAIAAAAPVTMMIKEAINAADEGSLASGLRMERRLSQMSLNIRKSTPT